MRIRRFLFGTLLFSCLLLLAQQARLAWAKDDDVLTVEGAIAVNTAASTVRINNMVLHVDDGTYISINDNLAYDDEDDEGLGLPQLGAFTGRNPDAYAIGEYMLVDGGIVATAIYVDTDQEVVGKLKADPARGTISVDRLTLQYDEDLSYIYIDDDDADLDDLANYLGQNPDAQGAVLFFTDGNQHTLTEVDVNSDAYIEGAFTFDPTTNMATVGGVAMRVSTEETTLTINEEDVELPDFTAFVLRNFDLRASADYYVNGADVTAMDLDLETLRTTAGTVEVDVPGSRVTIGGTALGVNANTSIFLNESPVLLETLVAYMLRNPGVLGSAAYTVDQTATACTVDVDTVEEDSGPITIDLATGRVQVGDTQVPVRAETELRINTNSATLAEMAAFLQRNPGTRAYASTAVDQGRYFTSIGLNTMQSASGSILLDLAGNTVTVGAQVAALNAQTRFRADWTDVTADEMVQWLAQHPDYYGQVIYAVDGDSSVAMSVTAYARRSSVVPAARRRRPRVPGGPAVFRTALAHKPTRPPAPPPVRKLPAVHSHKAVDMVGQLVGVDAARGTLTFLRRGTTRPIVVRVRQRTGIELNAARLPFAQLAQTIAPGQQLWMEMLYERRTRVARRIWVEQPLRGGTGTVLALAPRARQANMGLTLLVAVTRSGRAPHATSVQLQLLPHSLVLRGRRFIRPAQIRRGDVISFDGFTQNGKSYIPRVMVLLPKKH